MDRRMGTALGMGLLVTACVAAPAGAEPSTDKSQYHLLNPTPRHLMRPLSTDRPDITESPQTVDAGHFQIELSFLEYGRDGDDDAWSVLPMNLKVGLLNNADLQLVLTPYVEIEGDTGSAAGFSDAQLRLKINLWGNDSGRTALAVMPFIQFPTGHDDLSSDHVEGGIIVPLSIELPQGASLGLMGEVDFVRDSANEGYEAEFLHTIAYSRDITGPLGGYVEYIGVAPTEEGQSYRAVLGAGLTYALNDDTQLDLGVNIGLNRAAEDVVIFTGLSFRR